MSEPIEILPPCDHKDLSHNWPGQNSICLQCGARFCHIEATARLNRMGIKVMRSPLWGSYSPGKLVTAGDGSEPWDPRTAEMPR